MTNPLQPVNFLMKNKINALQGLLYEGAIFEVPDSGPWVLTNQNDEEICQGNSLAEMIENIPAQNLTTFEEIETGDHFFYLDDEYVKVDLVSGERVEDRFYWKFKQSEEIFIL